MAADMIITVKGRRKSKGKKKKRSLAGWLQKGEWGAVGGCWLAAAD
jgi:hypothetical protein